MSERSNLRETLGIRIVEEGPTYVKATMPIHQGISQYSGYVHGGATIALLESVASAGGLYWANSETERVFGIETCIRHWKSGIKGTVTGIAELDHCDGNKQIWNVAAYDDDGEVMSKGSFVTKVVSLERLAQKEREREMARHRENSEESGPVD